jgi:MFS family permease
VRIFRNDDTRIYTMPKNLLNVWPLFFGLTLMMIGNSLQGTLLGVRANIEDFSSFTTGLIMTAYYFGLLLGSVYVPRLVENVGHIRVFAALASIASTTVLLHGLYIDPIGWGIIRIITGFSYAGLYIVVESWLNDASTNETRGRTLGLYMIVSYVGMILGQMLLNIADPSDIELFVITSVLVSLALLPISLSRRPAPDFSASEPIKFSTIWKRSPLGIAGVVMNGLASAVVFSLGSIFILQLGYDFKQVSIFMIAFIMGGVAVQIPVAWISDRFDRRKVIVTLCALSALSAGVLYIGSYSNFWFLVVGIAMFGGFSLPIYGQCLSHVNDHLLPRQFIASSATLILLNGLGAALGPSMIGAAMDYMNKEGFAMSLLVSYASLFVFGLYRAFRVDAIPLEEQGDAIIMPARGSAMAIYNEDEVEQTPEN